MDIVFKLSDETRAVLEQMQGRRKTRTDRIRDMFVEVLPHQERNDKPTVPSEDAIRLQTRIDAEEFIEKIDALYEDPSAINQLKVLLLQWVVNHSPIRKDLHARLPEFAKELADNVVTNEGFAVLFGIELERVFGLVHESNMQKKDGPIVNEKRMKPEGWKAPDVAGELVWQGWQPSVAAKVWNGIPHTFDSLSIGGKPVQGIGEFSYEQGEDLPDGMCRLHGPLNGGDCVRCENAQYNGSEIDPVGEQSDDKLTAPVYPTMKAQPIDVSIWNRREMVEIPSALVLVLDMSIVCRVQFFNVGKERRLMIEFGANDELFGRWERLRQDEKLCDVSVDGATLGKTNIASVERGVMRPDGSYALQIEFVKAESTDG